MRVFVYKHLPLSKKAGKAVYSVKALDGPRKGRVITRTCHVQLEDVTPKVSEKGRQRVIKEKRKNVHAGLVGTLSSSVKSPEPDSAEAITYNPYKHPTFVIKDSQAPYEGSLYAVLRGEGVYVY